MVTRSSASTYHIHIYPLLMNEAEKCGFIYHVLVFYHAFFSRLKIPVSWKSSFPSCDGQLSLCYRLFPRSTDSYATNIHNGMAWGHLVASELIVLTFSLHIYPIILKFQSEKIPHGRDRTSLQASTASIK